MYSFILPNIANNNLLENIFFNIDWNELNINFNNTNDVYINQTLFNSLNIIKTDITKYESKWDIIKKYTNKYEFIHTAIPGYKISISKLKPLSRAFYKMIEMYNYYDLNNYFNTNIFCFSLAEGPGGFIEALIYLRQNPNDKFTGMTLIDTNDSNSNIPGWNKANKFLLDNSNVFIEYGPSKNGNLFDPQNYLYISNLYNDSCDLITGDGGFDFSVNYNYQEIMSIKLIFSQIMYALSIQKQHGCFILKIFDIFRKINVDLIYLLNIYYKEVYICKPHSSREANAEKYIVCKDFNINTTNSELLIKLKEYFYIFLVNTNNINNVNIESLFNINHNLNFLNKIKEINTVFGQIQIDNILLTLNIINIKNKNEKIEIFKKNNITKCIEWCKKYQIDYNDNNIFNTNMFIK